MRTPEKQVTRGVAGNIAKMIKLAENNRPSQDLSLRLGLLDSTLLAAEPSCLMSTVTACLPDHQVLGAGCHCTALPAGSHLGFRPPLHQQRVSSHGLSLHYLQRLPGSLHLCLSLRLTEKGEGEELSSGPYWMVRGGDQDEAQVLPGTLSVSLGCLPNVDRVRVFSQ